MKSKQYMLVKMLLVNLITMMEGHIIRKLDVNIYATAILPVGEWNS